MRRSGPMVRRIIKCAAMLGVAEWTLLLLPCVAQAGPPPLIPREVLFGNPDRAYPQISPDGQRLAYLAPDEGVLNIWVRTLGKQDDRPITRDRGRGIKEYFWAINNRQIVYLQDKEGTGSWHVYTVNLDTNEERDLTPFKDVQAYIVAVDPKFPDQILVSINRRTPEYRDVYRVDLESGALTLQYENKEGFLGFDADSALRVRAAMRVAADGGTELLVRDDPETAWRVLTRWAPEDILGSGSLAFTRDGRRLYVLSSTGSETRELRQINVTTGEQETLAGDRSADVADVFIHPVDRTVQAVSFNKERVRWKILDPSIKKDFFAIRRIRRGDFVVISRDHADKTWIIGFTTDDGPVSYYAFDRRTSQAEFLFTNRAALKGVRLAKMEPISFLSVDGLMIRGYLTTPPGERPRDLPMVVKVRSRAWDRDTWGYDGEVQWLANRGYAVLQVNFRGSTGYGKAFINAGDREWAGKTHQDLLDGVKWAVQQKIADPKRVAIMGSSFGGYATLVGLTFSPEVFACGVDMFGWSNLITFMENIPAYWKPIERVLWDRIGHPQKDAEFLRSRSPLFFVDRITKPLLIAQGANDTRVKKSETLEMVQKLQEAGKTVEYVEFPDEGHGFDHPENRLDFYARAERFLAKYIGGRYED